MWRTAALIGAALALAAWIVWCLGTQPPRIEETLRVEAERALAAADLADVRAAVNGRDAALEGLVASADSREEAELQVARLPGIRRVDNRLLVRARPVPVPKTYLEISTRPDGLALRGTVPNEALRLEVVERARQLFGEDRVDDRLAVDATLNQGAALAGAAGAVSALAEAGAGVRARLEGDSLRLSGTVVSEAARRRIESRARAAVPGVRLFFSALMVDGGSQPGRGGATEPEPPRPDSGEQGRS